jgi:cytochrome c-type biogenesis protein CcmH/NrfF
MLVQSLTWLWWTLPWYALLAGFLAVLGVRELRRQKEQ